MTCHRLVKTVHCEYGLGSQHAIRKPTAAMVIPLRHAQVLNAPNCQSLRCIAQLGDAIPGLNQFLACRRNGYMRIEGDSRR